METSPLVSVVIPTLNMAQFLPEALDSVLAQTYNRLEVHVVDDGSSDDTAAIMANYTKDARVFYHCRQKGGVAAARNFGIHASRGPLIALCDADDIWSTDKLALRVEAISRNDHIGVVYTEISAIGPNGEPQETRRIPRQSGKITEALFVTNFVTGSSSLIRRRFLDQVGLYDVSLSHAEDYDLWLRLSTVCEFMFLDHVTYFYRQWDGQSTTDKGPLIDHAILVRERFLRQNPRSVSRTAQRDAWSRLAVDRGLNKLRSGAGRSTAVLDIICALRYAPLSGRVWKAMVRCVWNREPSSETAK